MLILIYVVLLLLPGNHQEVWFKHFLPGSGKNQKISSAGMEEKNLISCSYKLQEINCKSITEPVFTWSRLTIEALEQGVKYVQS